MLQLALLLTSNGSINGHLMHLELRQEHTTEQNRDWSQNMQHRKPSISRLSSVLSQLTVHARSKRFATSLTNVPLGTVPNLLPVFTAW